MKNARCRKCGREWSGFAECHCTECHEHFSNERNFAQHIRGETHKHPSEVGLVEQERANGAVWVRAGEFDPKILRKNDD